MFLGIFAVLTDQCLCVADGFYFHTDGFVFTIMVQCKQEGSLMLSELVVVLVHHPASWLNHLHRNQLTSDGALILCR